MTSVRPPKDCQDPAAARPDCVGAGAATPPAPRWHAAPGSGHGPFRFLSCRLAAASAASPNPRAPSHHVRPPVRRNKTTPENGHSRHHSPGKGWPGFRWRQTPGCQPGLCVEWECPWGGKSRDEQGRRGMRLAITRPRPAAGKLRCVDAATAAPGPPRRGGGVHGPEACRQSHTKIMSYCS